MRMEDKMPPGVSIPYIQKKTFEKLCIINRFISLIQVGVAQSVYRLDYRRNDRGIMFDSHLR